MGFSVLNNILNKLVTVYDSKEINCSLYSVQCMTQYDQILRSLCFVKRFSGERYRLTYINIMQLSIVQAVAITGAVVLNNQNISMVI